MLSKANNPTSYKIKTDSCSFIYYRNRKYLTLLGVDKPLNKTPNIIFILMIIIVRIIDQVTVHLMKTNNNNNQSLVLISTDSTNRKSYETKSGGISKRPDYLNEYIE